ncbi:MAG: ester cyclase [Pseudomonadota bacterium]
MTQAVDAGKQRFQRYREMFYNLDPSTLAVDLRSMMSADCAIRLAHPLGDCTGPASFHEDVIAPLLHAIPDLERRDYIVIGGEQQDGVWIGCGGYYTGVFERPWLDIPPTRHLVAIRFMEFFRLVDGMIQTARLLWDIPSLMMQADAWPMGPSLGVDHFAPAPATQDGIVQSANATTSAASLKLVEDMIAGLERFADGGPEAMDLTQFWHPKMNWYGPAGIGSNRRLSGFRNWHQIPFLSAIPDRRANIDAPGYDCYFGDGDYVAYCGWPAITATVTGDGWLGIAPAGQRITMASLDFWRCENGVLRENWVLIDLLDIWRQLGVDVMKRMREVTFARQGVDFQT